MTDPDPDVPLRDLAGLGSEVPWPEPDAERGARNHRLPAAPGRPRSPYGRLAAGAEWLAGVQGVFPPRPPQDVRLVVVTARHLGADDGRSLDDSRIAAAAVADRSLPLFALAVASGARVEVFDAGEIGDPAVEDTGMTTQVVDGVDAGARLADRLVDDGADLLVLTEVSPGASTAAAALISVLTTAEPVVVAGRGSGLDDAGWAVKTAAIRDARRRGFELRTETEALIAAIGGRDIAVLAGVLLAAAARRVPVLVDGPSALAAAMVARDASPRITRWFRLAHAGTDLAEVHAVARMGVQPLLDLGLSGVGVTAGVGGLLALGQLRAAATLADGPLSLAPPEPEPEPEPTPDAEPEPETEAAVPAADEPSTDEPAGDEPAGDEPAGDEPAGDEPAA